MDSRFSTAKDFIPGPVHEAGAMPSESGSRVVLHVDMDAFYAAVEIREDPELDGKPVVVGADPRKHPRGVVLTASYEARRYGLRSAMSCVEALRRCPDAIFVPPHFELYGRVSGRDIKAAIRKDHRLSCSIGVAPTKALAKISSDHEKPDGLTVVTPDDVVEFLAPIPVRKISGVGPKTAERLKELGLESIGDVQRTNRQDLVELLGAFGEYVYDVALGRDAGEVVEPTGPPESISTETTFAKDLDTYGAVWPELEALAKSLHEQLLIEKYAYRTVTLKARYSNFETHTRSRSLKIHTNELEPILILSQMMLKEVLAPDRKVRLIGVRLSHLNEHAAPQATLAKWSTIPPN